MDVITEFRVSGRSDLDPGEAGDRMRDAHMAVAMEMATAMTSITAETRGANILELMERKKKNK